MRAVPGGAQWTIRHAAVYREGKRVTVTFGQPDDPAATHTEDWSAHQRLIVQRSLVSTP